MRVFRSLLQSLDKSRSKSRVLPHQSLGINEVFRIRTRPWSDWLDTHAGDACPVTVFCMIHLQATTPLAVGVGCGISFEDRVGNLVEIK
jgi:hypothetical protein